MGKYLDYQTIIQPPWLRDPGGMDAVHAGKGDTKDALVERAKAAVCARMPLKAPTDALYFIGKDRGMPRGPSETDATYAQRLADAWTTWKYAGTAFGVLKALSDAGYPNVVLLQRQQLYWTLDSGGNLVVGTLNGGGWREDFGSFWSRFTVLFPYPLPSAWVGLGTNALGAVVHTGSGAGVISLLSSSLVTDLRFRLYVVTSGTNLTAQVKVSLDDGLTWTSTIALNGSQSVSNVQGSVSFQATGNFTAGDSYYSLPTYSVPADGSLEATRIKALVNTWKPAVATVSRYVIHTAGRIWGWPVSAVYGSGTGLVWGGSTVNWAP